MVRRRQQNPSQNPSPSGFVRIISGLWRGRKLPVQDAAGLRPTTDRVKETLFNWLAQDIAKAHCLDLFAGSGSLGFEAASRQAASVTMVEMHRPAFEQLKRNVATVKAQNIELLHGDALALLKQPGRAFDIVFIDPPFHHDLIDQTVMLLEQNGWLSPQALIYIECEKNLTLSSLPADWQLYREKIAGQVAYRLFIRTTS
ncbi:16S rRNA (guanine(966)-N(2))-methyltransferase RsmD [Vibrio sp. SM6]|uniref:Ribosomal RNA small subunit methyltransferase D n=1 Tax=Vibrio agarilyticus TaxID=2726741 RepID=A0A7X8TS70_9VIBR|nr:16S rRNA (guanine(966)-N(2))-methyltransferase RsmD [Vibrio agarilyticus]NLS13637.1 16S rRNA (guanine(966)-N(2))-methyltransferase RsmD [Vibrio agarilyticus]